MKVVGLKAENVKRLKAVEITPDGNVVKITGKNGQGKTSVIDAIVLALGGDAATKLTGTTRPIRDGAEKAGVTVDLGDYIVTRTWSSNDKPASLKVESKDGKRLGSPQTLLNSFLGDLSFDPMEFLGMDSEKQVKTLQKIIGFDPKPLDDARKAAYEERTIVNREIKDLTAYKNTLNSWPGDDLPEQELQLTDVLNEFQAAQDVIRANQSKKDSLEALRREAVAKKTELTTLKDEIHALEQRIEELRIKYDVLDCEIETITLNGKALAAEVTALPPDPELAPIQAKMTNIETINRKVRERAAWRKADMQHSEKVDKGYALTQRIEAIDKQKEDAIKNAKLPIAGLSFSETGVEFGGVPLPQISFAEKLRVSMACGMAINPTLRVMFIKDGDKFDSDSWKLVEDMAEANDYQLFVEMVDESGKVGFYIEDGAVKPYVEPIRKFSGAGDTADF